MCLSLTLSPAWPRLPLLHSTLRSFFFFFFRFKDLFDSTAPRRGGFSLTQPRALSTGPANTSYEEHRARTHSRHAHTDASTPAESVNNTQTPALQLCLLTAARPPRSSSEVKICYIMQPSIDFPPLAVCQLPAPKSELWCFVPWGDSYSLPDGVAELDTQTETRGKVTGGNERERKIGVRKKAKDEE